MTPWFLLFIVHITIVPIYTIPIAKNGTGTDKVEISEQRDGINGIYYRPMHRNNPNMIFTTEQELLTARLGLPHNLNNGIGVGGPFLGANTNNFNRQLPFPNGPGGTFDGLDQQPPPISTSFQNIDNSVVNFAFGCKCAAKTPPKNTSSNQNSSIAKDQPQTPETQSNMDTTETVQRLRDQLRQYEEKLRSEQQRSAFEQFAHLISIAEGLDCECAGSSAPRTLSAPLASNPFQTRLQPLPDIPAYFP